MGTFAQGKLLKEAASNRFDSMITTCPYSILIVFAETGEETLIGDSRLDVLGRYP